MKNAKKSWHKLLKNRTPRTAIFAGLGIIAAGSIWAVLSISANADTATTVSFQAENGTKTGNVAQIADASAAGGSAVQFGSGTPQTGERTCPAYPLPPDASCTGVPAGTNLTTVSGNLTTSSNGQVINARLIAGDLLVTHGNVTVTNSRIKGRIINNASNGLTVTDSDIGADSCPSGPSPYNNFNGTNYTMLRSRVHNAGADLMGMGGTGTILIKDSIVNQACWYPEDHLDAIQFYAPGSVGIITLDHSVFDARPVNVASEKGNAAIIWADNPGSGSRLTVTKSFLAGGNYTTMLFDAGANSGVIIDINNTTYAKNAWTYGPCAMSNSVAFNGTSGIKFTNNRYDDATSFPNC